MCMGNCFLALIALLVPPLAVCLKDGCCSADFCINLGLTLLGYIPGLLHALYIIFREPEYRAAPNGREGPTRIIVIGNPPATYVRQQQRANRQHGGSPSRPVYVQQGYERALPDVPTSKSQRQAIEAAPVQKSQKQAVEAPPNVASASTSRSQVSPLPSAPPDADDLPPNYETLVAENQPQRIGDRK